MVSGDGAARRLRRVALAGLLGVGSWPALAGGSYADFLRALAIRESSGLPWKENHTTGYIGLYQMGEAALIDAGYYRADGTARNDWRGPFTGKDGLTDKAAFLANPDAQNRAVTAYHQRVLGYLRAAGLDRYVGQYLGGTLLTESGLLAGAHLLGVGGLARYLRSGGAIDPRDGLGTPISSYVARFAGYQLSATAPSYAQTRVPGVPNQPGGHPPPGPQPAPPPPPGRPRGSIEQEFVRAAGISPGQLRQAIAALCAALLLLWAGWSVALCGKAWQQGRLRSLFDLQWTVIRALIALSVVLMLLR